MPLFGDSLKLGLLPRYANTASKTVAGTTETSLFPTGTGTPTIQGGWYQPGNNVRFVLRGWITTPALSVGTLTVKVKSNGAVLAQATSGTLGLGQTNAQFLVSANVICYTAGTTGTLSVAGEVRYPTGLYQFGSTNLMAESVVTDTTVDQLIDITATFSLGSHSMKTILSTMELMAQN